MIRELRNWLEDEWAGTFCRDEAWTGHPGG